MEFYIHIMYKAQENSSQVMFCLHGGAGTGKSGLNFMLSIHIPANQKVAYKEMPPDIRNTYRTKHLKWLLGDEFSVIGNKILNYLYLHLQEIKNNNLPFGGVDIIGIGDLYQLKPVKMDYIFADIKDDYGPLAINLCI